MFVIVNDKNETVGLQATGNTYMSAMTTGVRTVGPYSGSIMIHKIERGDNWSGFAL